MTFLKLASVLIMISLSGFQLHGQQIESQHLSKARKIYEKITGTKIRTSDPVVQEIALLIKNGDLQSAVAKAIEQPNFLNITVKQMANLMSLRDETIRTKLNDFSASFIGVTRDDLDARLLLSGNFYYRGDSSRIPASVRQNMGPDLIDSNNHYNDLDDGKINIGAVLTRVDGQQLFKSSVEDPTTKVVTYTLVPNPDPAGVLTSRTFLTQHVIAGTNRRAIEYTFREFMCVPIADWADTSASDVFIGPDIDRYPGGDNSKFQTNCKGCHTQMDSLRLAFAYWDVDGDGRVRQGQVRPFGSTPVADKYRRNLSVYPPGYVVKNNRFTNNSNGPGNAALFGWRGQNTSYGLGVHDLGVMISNSERFSLCMARRAVEATCKVTTDIKTQKADLKKIADKFESSGYKMKSLFTEAVLSPFCG